MGPQKAVTAPVIRQQQISALYLMCFMSAPAISANSSPNRVMSKSLFIMQDMTAPAAMHAAMTAICGQVVYEKLPEDQL